jgi:hypothetical protein
MVKYPSIASINHDGEARILTKGKSETVILMHLADSNLNAHVADS